ncbi:hypothetical protein EVJ58_g7043 [Rhodofomes roseus]|uniref:BTB domain-containing protein n=1 Tax=Rhodofomes roseus TaxID=34475 RepID=A0A4Y9Y753_9APHY|nr:hypothetical protein EVJ58_g7043 [Rhodofomes roseus]
MEGVQSIVKRDEAVWFEDGNVVLQAGEIAFRVYQGLLAMNSEVFAGMFSVPQPDSVERLDGCPVIHLPDHPDDLRHLLRVLFIDKRFHRRDEQFSFAIIAALARLAHKYDIKDLLDDALHRMKSCFSNAFHDWAPTRDNECVGSPLMAYVETDAIAAVNIARLTDTPSMLPTALYVCCQLDTDNILNGVPRGHDAVERLSSEDITRCLDARLKLVHDNVVSAFSIFTIATSDGCTSQKNCLLLLEELLEIEAEGRGLPLDNCSCLEDWIPPLREDAETGPILEGLCASCQAMVQQRAADERKEVWERLPAIMGVEVNPWIT